MRALAVGVRRRVERVERTAAGAEFEQRGGNGAVQQDHPTLLVRDVRSAGAGMCDMQPGERAGRTGRRVGRRSDARRQRHQQCARIGDQRNDDNEKREKDAPDHEAMSQ